MNGIEAGGKFFFEVGHKGVSALARVGRGADHCDAFRFEKLLHIFPYQNALEVSMVLYYSFNRFRFFSHFRCLKNPEEASTVTGLGL
jgi:hypothetical protein